jgi:hypothetical protein
MPERIDVNFTQPNNENSEQLEIISARAFALLKHAISVVKANYWRIAVNLVIQADDDSSDSISGSMLFNALSKPLSHQVGKESIEWQIMSNCPQDVLLGEEESEKLNVITVLAQQVNLMTNAPVVITQLDVSTSAINREYRFNNEKLGNFYSSALQIIESIIRDVEEKWKNV